MMRQLLSRLQTCSRAPLWFIMPLLLASLVPTTSNAATPPVDNLEYEFSVDHISYKSCLKQPVKSEADFFNECLEIKRGLAYEILRLNTSKLSEYGYTNIFIQEASNSNGEYISPQEDDSYFLPKGKYYIHWRYDNSDMETEHEVKALDAIGLQDSWTPHSVTFRAFIDSMVEEFNDGAVYGIAEIDDSGAILRFVPFNENNTATLIQTEHKFETTSATNADLYQQTHTFKNLMKCHLCSYVNGKYLLSGNLYYDQDMLDWFVYSLKSTDFVVAVFDPLRSKGYISNKSKCGIIFNGNKYTPKSNESWQAEISNLLPDECNTLQLFYEYDGEEYVSNEIYVTTTPIKATITVSPNAQSATVKFGHTHFTDSQGEIVYENWSVYKKNTSTKIDIDILSAGKNIFTISGLAPGTSYTLNVDCYYRRKSDGTKKLISSTSQTSFTTDAAEWNNGEALALTTTKARLTYSTNLDNVADTYVEWRRVDAPAVVQSTKAVCPVVEWRLVGVLNNLNPDVYYQFRPVYENGATKVYGEWVGVFTGDANVWFDPEVETRPARVRNDGSVTLRGSVLPGSGDISEQGFEIWSSDEPSSAGAYAYNHTESAHRFVTCDGINLSVDISDLAAGATYVYRAYAKVNGVTHTGNEETFGIPGTGGVDGIAVDEESPEIVGYYNLQGIRSDRPFEGINIIVYSNGKTGKRVFNNL